MTNPFTGIGKPELLKHELAGCWSRRITQEHRLVYRVTQGRICFLLARYRYDGSRPPSQAACSFAVAIAIPIHPAMSASVTTGMKKK